MILQIRKGELMRDYDKQLEELEGIKSLNFGLYILPTETIRWIIVSVL